MPELNLLKFVTHLITNFSVKIVLDYLSMSWSFLKRVAFLQCDCATWTNSELTALLKCWQVHFGPLVMDKLHTAEKTATSKQKWMSAHENRVLCISVYLFLVVQLGTKCKTTLFQISTPKLLIKTSRFESIWKFRLNLLRLPYAFYQVELDVFTLCPNSKGKYFVSVIK